MTRPPRVARWLMRATLPGPDRGVVLGDLSEAFEMRANERGERGARRWYWRQTVKSLVPNLRRTIARWPMRPVRGRDVRFASRTLRRSPWYAGGAISVIAVSMSLATTVFAIVDGVLFKPLPYAHPKELYQVSGNWSAELRAAVGGAHQPTGDSKMQISARDVQDLRAAVPTAGLTMVGPLSGAQSGDMRTWVPTVARIDREFFAVLGVQPIVGGFATTDFEITNGTVLPALVTYGTWQARLGGRVDAVGQTLGSDSAGTGARSYRVVGVLPREFLFPASGRQPDLLTPLALTPADQADRARRGYTLIARLPPDRALSEYRARFDVVGKAGREQLPDRTNNGGLGDWDTWVPWSLAEIMTVASRNSFATVAFYAAGLLALLGCLNVAGLVASRGLDRSRELAMRRALGAAPRHVASLVLSECLVLVVAGSAIGLVLSYWMIALAVTLLPGDLGLLKTPALDWRVAMFAIVATIVAIGGVAVWPIRRALRTPSPSVAGAGPGQVRSTGRFVVMSLQVAVGLMLALAGTFLVGSLMLVWRTDIGFRASDLIVVGGRLTETTPEARLATTRSWMNRVRAVPGVEAVGATTVSVLDGGTPGGEFRGDTYPVLPGFFEALGPRLLEGRFPTPDELDRAERVVVVSRKFATGYFGDRSPIGQSVSTPRGPRTYQVIGLVDEMRLAAWTSQGFGRGQIYRPAENVSGFSAFVRVTAPASAVMKQLLDNIAPDLPMRLSRVAFADDLLLAGIRPERFRSWAFGSFGAAALLIVGVGVLGLIAMATARRTREVGVRMALGATRLTIVNALVVEQLPALFAGLAGGLLLGVLAVAMVRGYMYGLAPYDPRAWLVAVFVVAAVALIGVLIPARQAGRIDPSIALRSE